MNSLPLKQQAIQMRQQRAPDLPDLVLGEAAVLAKVYRVRQPIQNEYRFLALTNHMNVCRTMVLRVNNDA
jgi:hypothetical protein